MRVKGFLVEIVSCCKLWFLEVDFKVEFGGEGIYKGLKFMKEKMK